MERGAAHGTRSLNQGYRRAKRLYQACIASGVDNGYFEQKITDLERVWKESGNH